MSAVIADRRVTEALGAGQLDAICGEFSARLRSRGPVEAICDTAAGVAMRLKAPLPRQQDDVNELADALVFID
jgi:uncharacterized membrane protein